MKRIEQYQRILRRRQTVPLNGRHPIDPMLRSLLVHAAFADAKVEPDELAVLALIIPERPIDQLEAWVATEASKPLDFAPIRAAVPKRSDRISLIRLVHTMVHIDQDAVSSELTLIDNITQALLD